MEAGFVRGLYVPIFSIKRPSRGALASATITSNFASFLRPLRANLILTAIFCQFLNVGTRPFFKVRKDKANFFLSNW
jgi:hypothetical protein